jgi:CPA2 family monovalent cation:H+ antiporter-2
MQGWHSFYYSWLEHLQARQKRNLLWQLSRKRFVQIGVEMLFVTGLMVFSEQLLEMVEDWLGENWLFPHGPATVFWVVLTLFVLAPLVAIWRNSSALCLLFAQIITTGNRRASRMRPIVEGVFKIVVGAGLYVWLSALLPLGTGTKWMLLGSGVMALAALIFLKRRLVYWHSELEIELKDVLEGSDEVQTATSAPWLRPHGDWNLSVIDCVLPDLAECQGKSIAETELRKRFGCTVVGIGRQGYMISLPSPDTVLYPRDKVLLLGTAEQLEAGKRFLISVSAVPPAMADFEDVRMETVLVPRGSEAVGKDLRTLSPTQHYRVQIAGLKRDSLRLLNPGAEEAIRADDELLVLGTPDRIRDFRDWLNDAPADSRAAKG